MAAKLDVMHALKTVVDPEIHRNVMGLNMVRDLVMVEDGRTGTIQPARSAEVG